MISLFERTLQTYKTKTQNDTDQANKYSKQQDKKDTLFPCFCHKITSYVQTAHCLSLALSSSQTHTYSISKLVLQLKSYITFLTSDVITALFLEQIH